MIVLQKILFQFSTQEMKTFINIFIFGFNKKKFKTLIDLSDLHDSFNRDTNIQ